MKYKIIKIIGYIACIITILASVMFFVKGTKIPALEPFSVSIIMLSLVCSTKQQYNEGKVDKELWRSILVLGSVAGIVSIIGGILEIITAIEK